MLLLEVCLLLASIPTHFFNLHMDIKANIYFALRLRVHGYFITRSETLIFTHIM